MMDLLLKVERFLQEAEMAPTTFGKEAMRDPNFVRNLRNGLDPRSSTIRRVEEYMDRASTSLSGDAA